VTEPDDGFLNRWSRRKLESDKVIDAPAPDPEALPETVPEPVEGGEDQVALDLPDIDTLDKDSDFSVFMQEGVPEELKKLALRALWRSDPVLANLDGLNDYDEDFGSLLKVGAEFMRKLALEEQDKDTGDAFRPREEPADPEIDETDETDESEEIEEIEDVVVAEAPDEDAAETGLDEGDETPGEKS
jgi:hypothetical protein